MNSREGKTRALYARDTGLSRPGLRLTPPLWGLFRTLHPLPPQALATLRGATYTHPVSLRNLLLAGAVFAGSLLVILLSGRLQGDYRIDEVHKISETFFLRLIEDGDLHNPVWLASPVERTNPPVGKILFGLAIQASGQPLPPDLQVARLTESGHRLPPPEWDRRYRQWLRPVRLVSGFVTAATVALVFLAGVSATDLAGGLICAILYSLNFLVATFSTTAVFDPLLAFFVLLAAVLSLNVEPDWLAGLACSLAAALAFNVRITGLLAIGACLLILLTLRRLRAAMLAVASFPIAALALNPYYWVPGTDGSGLPARIVSRILLQQHDLRTLLQRELALQGPLDTIPRKFNFLFQYALGDWSGIAILLGILFLIAAALLAKSRSPRAVAVGIWSAFVALVIAFWMPIAFPRYLLVAVPPLALLGGMGWRFAATGIAEVITNVSTSPRENPNGK